jgi:hypothetical protein
MNEDLNPMLAHALGAYRKSLRQIAPPSAARERFLEAAHQRLADRAQVRRHRWQSLAAGVAAAVVGGSVFYGWRDANRQDSPPVMAQPASPPPAPIRNEAGQLVRVRGALATRTEETQYWLDVRVGPDGAMRIERVIPVDPHHYGSF